MLTKICDDLYIDLNKISAFSTDSTSCSGMVIDGEKVFLSPQQFKALCEVIDGQHKSYLPTEADMFNARLEALCDTKSSSVVDI